MKNKAIKGDELLLALARRVIENFSAGIIENDKPRPDDWFINGFTSFGEHLVRYTEGYIAACDEFTRAIVKKLDANSTSEANIYNMCTNAGQAYVALIRKINTDENMQINNAANGLINKIRAEGDKSFTHIEPNFAIKHIAQDIVQIGPVRSMKTELVDTTFGLSLMKPFKVELEIGKYPDRSFRDNTHTLGMPENAWVVEVNATEDNVVEEAKWLIDIAVSLMRLSSSKFSSLAPKWGDLEAHPISEIIRNKPRLTIGNGSVEKFTKNHFGYYEITEEVANDLNSPKVLERTKIIFNAPKNSLARRVSQGLGWMTRGRQTSDRSERLLACFTALEALLTSNSTNDPVAQTISRHAAVIYSQDIAGRKDAFDQLKSLYSLRSTVVHSGGRNVLWGNVNALQEYVERIFWIVLNRCDLNMKQDRFFQSLADASHGSRWEFAPQQEPPPTNSQP